MGEMKCDSCKLVNLMNNVFGLQERLEFGCLLSSAAKRVLELGVAPSSQW